jgi:hypothetical protein
VRVNGRRLRSIDWIHIAYFTAVAATVLVFAERVPNAAILAAANLAAALLLAGLAAFVLSRMTSPAATVARCAIATVVIPFAFTELAFVVGYVNPNRFESALIGVDVALFGVDPMRAIEPWHHPAVTELLQIVYASFYFIPLALGLALARKRRWPELETAIATILVGFYLSYVGYALVPAQSPYHLFEFEKPLVGLFLTDSIRAGIDVAEIHRLNCFPSGHVEVTFVTIALARRYARGLFAALLPWGCLLFAATIYLRYHYTIDTLVGLALVPIVVWTGGWLRSRIDGNDSDLTRSA